MTKEKTTNNKSQNTETTDQRTALINEILSIPDTNPYKLRLQNIMAWERDGMDNNKLSQAINGVLADYDFQIVMPMEREKLQASNEKIKKLIVSDLNTNDKITVIDTIMGSGKSSYIIDKVINGNSQQSYLCVLPTLNECQRYVENIDAKIFEPKSIKGRKLKGLQRLISDGRNIVTTHALIKKIDGYTMELLKNSNYVLVIDECLDVVHQYNENFKKSDFRSIFNDGYVTTDEQGFLLWNEDREKNYDGRWNDIKNLCNLRSLMCLKKKDDWSEKIIMWNFPIAFFYLFEKCYICTYLWNGSMQKAYFDLHKIKYSHMALNNGELETYDPEKEKIVRKQKWSLINLYSGSLNKIGVPDRRNRYPLSKGWYERKFKKERESLTILKNNTYNYFRNIAKTEAEKNMFTTFKDYQGMIKQKGYAKGFVSCNSKGTNEYRDKTSLAYLINCYPPTNIINFFKSYGVNVNQDLYAVSELLQWIWRSAIRDDDKINLYLPSLRMRELLGKWALSQSI